MGEARLCPAPTTAPVRRMIDRDGIGVRGADGDDLFFAATFS